MPETLPSAKKSKPAQQGRRAATAAPEVKRGETKQARVITLLGRDGGATLDELIAATGWLPHTTHAALTGLRHKVFVLDRDKRADGTTVYRISSAPVLQVRPTRADAMAYEDTPLEDEIARLRGFDLPGLQARWRTMFGRRAPAHLPKHLLLRIVAYRLQAEVHGDLDPASVRSLERLAKAGSDNPRRCRRQAPSNPAPCSSASGTGCSIASRPSMMVLPGMAHYRSLSEVARAITGTRWNGPPFFGLREGA